MPGTSSIHEFLREARVPYAIVPHRPAYTAQEEAAATHVPGRDWAKVVVCFIDGAPVQAVLPAPLAVNLERLLELARGGEIRLAREDELRRLYPDCEPGAMPAFGPLYEQPVFVDVALAEEPEIVSTRARIPRRSACAGRTSPRASGRSSASSPILRSTTSESSGCRTGSRVNVRGAALRSGEGT
jgi:Ala-tRNA(Pro) deacylase